MADITTTRIFTDGEKGITAAKLNDIIGSSTIQPAFVSTKPVASTADPADNMLILKAAGAYAQVPVSTLTTSIGNALPSPDSEIWLVRLRSFNAVGNPNFEVDQRNVGTLIANPAGAGPDRWLQSKAGTLVASGQQVGGAVAIPGINFSITRAFYRFTLTTQQASLGISDFLRLYQFVEGSSLRELISDVTSISLLVRTSVAGLKFSVMIQDNPATKTLVKLATIPSANTWTLIQLPNLPQMTVGNFAVVPGVVGYLLQITLAAGANLLAPAADTWQAGNFMGAPGMSNFAASPVNSTFDIAFLHHEPGPLCSTLIDKPFTQNLDECLRYYQKSYDYDVALGTANAVGYLQGVQQTTTAIAGAFRFFKPMAKIPTVTCYNMQTGGVNGIRLAGIDYAVSSINSPGKSGFVGMITGSAMPAPTAGSMLAFHYTADTGW